MAKKKKELKAILYLVSIDKDGNRKERLWDDLTPEEKLTESVSIHERFFAALGYKWTLQEGIGPEWFEDNEKRNDWISSNSPAGH